jgi:hypothetical protein
MEKRAVWPWVVLSNVVFVWLGGFACGSGPSSELSRVGGGSEDTSVIQGALMCGEFECGGNSPIVNNNPLGPLHLDGLWNAQGYRLIPKLLDGPYGIEVKEGELIGIPLEPGLIELRDLSLRGHRFVIQHLAGSTVTVTIQNVARVPLFREAIPPRADEYAWVYEFIYRPAVWPSNGNLCPSAAPWRWPAYKVPFIGDGVDVLGWDRPGFFAFIVRGETYDPQTASVALSGDPARRWINVACSGTALSKMKLLGYDPEDQARPTTPDQRQATLKMLTARYCRNHPAEHFTVAHQPLAMENYASWVRSEVFDVATVEGLESLWNKQGALCLSTPRRVLVDEVRAKCGADAPPPCETLGTFGLGLPLPANAEWVTHKRHR